LGHSGAKIINLDDGEAPVFLSAALKAIIGDYSELSIMRMTLNPSVLASLVMKR
jgi:hypothetical protein